MASNEYIKWTSIDDLISQLEELKAHRNGDGTIPVCINGISDIELTDLPFYYDGGYNAVDVNDDTNIVHSKTTNPKGYTEKTPGFHDIRIDLREATTDEEDFKVNGRSVLEIDPYNWNWYIEIQQKERVQFDGQLVRYRLLKEKNEEWSCYPFEASVCFYEEGYTGRVTALGRNMAEARNNLLEEHKKVKERL